MGASAVGNGGAGRPLALVTGASAGIGAAFAERLAPDGYELVLVARRRDRLEDLAQLLRDEVGSAAEILVADLTRADQLAAVEWRAEEDPAPDLLVNNAGFPGYMPFAQLDPDRAEELIRLHILAATRLTRATLPGMPARWRGAIVNVASMLAFSAGIPADSPLPKRAVYAACKAYLVAFTELLSGELAGSGVRVQVLCPPLVAGTEFHRGIPGFEATRAAVPAVRPDEMVAASLAALQGGELLCSPALDDPELVEQHREAERRLMAGAATGRLAPRYRI